MSTTNMKNYEYSSKNCQESEVTSTDCQVFACANFLLDTLQNAHFRDITNLALQKLLFLSYGFFLWLDEAKLFECPVRAWSSGPVIPDVYLEFKNYGVNPIGKSRVLTLNTKTQEYTDKPVLKYPASEEDEPQLRSLEFAIMVYIHRHLWEATNVTDRNHSAWAKTATGEIIADDLIINEMHYRGDMLSAGLFGRKKAK